ncbi:MAG: hypothetical protein AAF492_23385, partial [Verrucomicrobiota bacterium]
YYRMVNDKENNLGEFPLPHGKIRLFIKEPAVDGDAIRSQAFLGEDWAKYTPLFAPLDLYVGVAQDVKVERFSMQPEGGPQKNHDEVTCPRFTMDGEEGVTKPFFRHHRTRHRYRLQNFKTEQGEAVTVPLTIKEHMDGEWLIEKIQLKEITGERNDLKEEVIPHDKVVTEKRIDVNNVEFEVKLPPTSVDQKYDLFITYLKKFRRYNPPKK